MHSEPGPDVSLSSLGGYRARLSEAEADVEALNRDLAIGLASFELSRESGPGCEIGKVAEARLPEAILAVLESPGPCLQDLMGVCQSITGEDPALRTQEEPPLFGRVSVTPPALIERALGRFFEWIASPGYRELHPVEQMAICQMRLLEIHPFSRCSRLSGRVLSYAFPAGAGYLLPRYRESDLKSLDRLLEEALGFSTRGFVDLHVQAIKRSYRWALKEAGV